MEQKKFDFKKLELQEEKSWVSRVLLTKTTLFVVVGAILSSTYYYFNEWQYFSAIGITDIIEGTSVGALMGYFMANSPCANNKC